MPILCCNVAALTVALIYYMWRSYNHARLARQRVLRERVAHMLWVMADRIDAERPMVTANGHG
jgi:hypothetical protein